MSDHEDEEILRRRAREQAEIERQTDALVLRTLTAMVTASEELKAKLRRDTESLLEGYRRTRRQLEGEIAMTTAERVRSRREAEQERAEIVREARVQAREIVEAAKRERETMLTEARAMEQRLRGLEDQIRSVFGQSFVGLDARPETTSPPAPTPALPFVPSSPAMPGPRPATPASSIDDATPDAADSRHEPGEPVAEEPAPTSPDAGTKSQPEPPSEDAAPAATVDLPGVPAGPAAPAATSTPIVSPTPAAPAPTPAPDPGAMASFVLSAPPPAPDRAARPAPFPLRAYSSQPAPARRRPVELVFDGVPGYQQASALERAVNDLLPNEEIDILQFDRGQLVLGLQATDLGRLAEQLVAGAPASLELDGVDGDRARFRCI